jgi:hypothetical protein
LPGENHVFTISGKAEDLLVIQKSVASVLWSHNRVVNGS